jgi:hypothetical protein
MRADNDIMGSQILFEFEFIKNIMIERSKVNNNYEPLPQTKYHPKLRSDRFVDEIF